MLDKSLLICSKKKFKRLYLDSLADDKDFAKYERARCIRHLSVYEIITTEHKNIYICKESK